MVEQTTIYLLDGLCCITSAARAEPPTGSGVRPFRFRSCHLEPDSKWPISVRATADLGHVNVHSGAKVGMQCHFLQISAESTFSMPLSDLRPSEFPPTLSRRSTTSSIQT